MLPLAVDGKTLWFSQTEVPWEVYDLFFLREQDQVDADGVSAPSRSVFPVDRGYGHEGSAALGMTIEAARHFAEWMCLVTGRTYRLPTESEWNAAATTGLKNGPIGDYAWHAGNSSGMPHPVAERVADRNDLYDMIGNLAEFAENESEKGIVCGGSFLDSSDSIGPAHRQSYELSWQTRDPQWPKSVWWMSDGGFVAIRIVCETPEPKPSNHSSS